jgi:V/A-type H+-transporting ATPase subunit B
VDHVIGAGLGEMVEVIVSDTDLRKGQVIELHDEQAVIQLFGVTDRINPGVTQVRFSHAEPMADLSPLMIGRLFDGGGRPIDGDPPVIPHLRRNINGAPINPSRRANPSDFIQTGFSAIDGLNTLVRGQKLPLFSGAGLPVNTIAARIVVDAKVVDETEPFSVVFAGMGLTAREADFFIEQFRDAGAMDRVIGFFNLADDPVIERLLTPRFALTVAEYLAFDLGMQALVVMTDMTQYCNALREVASSREEIPGRRGYPGYMYTDLASLFERAGRIEGRPGSVTQIPVLTMPDDDITHPIPDLTGYITEGQIVLDRDLHRKGVFPPINVLPSLSRLMNVGIGDDKTRHDHKELSDQIYLCYAKGVDQRKVAAIIGEEGLTERDRQFLQFADAFERRFINQRNRSRSITDTLDLGWELLAAIPRSELIRVSVETLDRYLPTATAIDANEE